MIAALDRACLRGAVEGLDAKREKRSFIEVGEAAND
jgi:hypothetical protein